MKNTKFVKARCGKTNSAFAIEVKQFGDTWKAVDFVKLTPEQDAKFESQIDVESLTTADSIQACSACGQRKVGGCGCAKRTYRSCSPTDPYRFQCIYCNELHLDFDAADGAREGEQITLSQGQTITLTHRGASISKLLVGMGWKPSRTSHSMDLDASVVMITDNWAIHDTIYFGRLRDDIGSIIHYGDNLTGSVKINGESDDENISIDLTRVPQNVKCLTFIVNIYNAYDRHQVLSEVDGMHIRLIEETSKKVLAKYSTLAQDRSSTGLIIGAAYRSNGKWNFAAMGDCFRVSNLHDLARISCDLCKKLIRG